MVGVPGKSKGCNTCRKRKIACGLQTPACIQCIKSKRVCTGYQREKLFVLVQPGEKNRKKKRVVLRGQGEDDDKSPPSSGSELQTTPRAETEIIVSPEITTISKSIDRQMILNSFLAQFTPVSRTQRLRGTTPWISMMAGIPIDQSRALEASMFALSAAALGRSCQDRAMVVESLALYNKGLNELQKALYDPSTMYSDETLAACLALGMYEVMECPANGRHGYESHCRGILSLVQNRGVNAHTSPLGLQLFLAARGQGILYSIQYHAPTFLASTAWMEIPWMHSKKEPIDRIMDCLAVAPRILQRTDAFPRLGPAEQANLAYDICLECWQLDRTLQEIYDDLTSNTSSPLFWPEPSRDQLLDHDDNTNRLFPVAFNFPDLRIASTLMIFWATRLMLWSGLCNLYQLINAVDPSMIYKTATGDEKLTDNSGPCLTQLGYSSNYLSLARNVCQSVEYCLQEEMRVWGLFTVSTGLGIVLGTVQNDPQCRREVHWIQAMLGKIQARGLRIWQHGISDCA
ncbi:hypothetical protein ASPZODRAFT_149516 [Penicilliopsis zonata CBS 506.65]|uniref:Zn(2)-C6 fungal-type domain-containing protein n=1 Tax=Penicilliopsis zonata CBS 506.65 TaxID=1073090 RepID=A0A1L9SSM9_9EURO|nr:hypothetical protein ASPZODRAFT_149516 [Penicilliopsis zonata CBS 506.65]OJJ50107.1 hypothetical protein ASPZODRAFT_149516 [Penicilliopsis zonata CBS 506.65]